MAVHDYASLLIQYSNLFLNNVHVIQLGENYHNTVSLLLSIYYDSDMQMHLRNYKNLL